MAGINAPDGQSLMAVARAILAVWIIVPGAAVGQTAPPFSLPLLNDTASVALDELRGSVVYVDFWASWCTSCRNSFPWMNEVQARYGQRNFRIIAVNLDDREDQARDFLVENPAEFSVAYDPAGLVAESYHVKGMPSSYLIDRNGQIRFVHQGFFQSDRAELEHRIEQLIADGL